MVAVEGLTVPSHEITTCGIGTPKLKGFALAAPTKEKVTSTENTSATPEIAFKVSALTENA